MSVAPRCRLFVGVAGAQYRRLIEQAADDLQRERQAARIEAAAHRQGGVAADVERCGERRLREQGRGGNGLELFCRLAGSPVGSIRRSTVDSTACRLRASSVLSRIAWM